MTESQVAAAAAVACIAAALGPRGQWPGVVSVDADPAESRRDVAAPLTALGVLALQEVPAAGVDELVRRSRLHIELSVLPGGLWRYYANIPPDTDDTAMCALALGLDHPVVAGQTRASLAATCLPDGLLPTWFEPDWQPVVDPVPVAHVVAVLGAGPLTERAVTWLNSVVADGRETHESAYYPDPLDTHVAISRAVERGVEGLRPALIVAQERAINRLRAQRDSPYRTAQSLVVIEGLHSSTVQTARGLGRERLLHTQTSDGSWPAATLFVARRSDGPGLCHYRSWAVVSALCVRALMLPIGHE